MTGAAEVDPAFVIALTVIGAAFKFALLWVVVLCIPVLISVLSVSGRIGMETRKGLVELLRLNYGRLAALSCALVVIVINLAMIVAALLAVMALFGALLTPYLLVWQTASGRASNDHEEHLHATESYVGALLTIVLACSIMTAAALGLDIGRVPWT